jgi:hypothetical protein
MLNDLRNFLPALSAFGLLSLVTLVGSTLGYSAVILCLTAVALSTAIFLIYSSLTEGSDTHALSVEEALSLVSPTAEEEEKRAVLRALNDLQFERSLGKITEKDYQEGAKEYRRAASRLIAQADQSLAGRKQAAIKRFEQFSNAELRSSEQMKNV